MGYFSNATEGDYYEQNFCVCCLHWHDGTCPVWDIHSTYNYDQCKDTPEGKVTKAILDQFIPRDGIHNLPCTMMFPIDAREKLKLMEWNKRVKEENEKEDTSIKSGDPAQLEGPNPLP